MWIDIDSVEDRPGPQSSQYLLSDRAGSDPQLNDDECVAEIDLPQQGRG